MPRRILITGAEGLLGTPTAARFAADTACEVLAPGHGELDITDAARVAHCFETFQPDLVVNCAAFTRVDDCESSEALACRVNGEGAGHVAEAAARAGARLIHISTDYVFDGCATSPLREDAPTAPPDRLSAYGRSKLLGEQAVRSRHPSALIVRTAWIYGPDGPGFPATILRLARERPRLRVVVDQRGSPTYAPDLAEAIQRLARLDADGIVHVTNAGDCTWHELAVEICRRARLDTPVDPVTTAEFPRPARRPAYSVLDNSRYIELTGAPLRSWREALGTYLSTRSDG